jgi:hypothetical protein
MLIETGTDYGFTGTARRENYLALAARLSEFPLFPGLVRIQFH